jgi:circadian clock protein KaiC
LSQEAREKAAALARKQELERIDRDRTRKREALEVRITALRKEFEFEEQDAETMSAEVEKREELVAEDRKAMARSRKADTGDGFAVSKRNKK